MGQGDPASARTWHQPLFAVRPDVPSGALLLIDIVGKRKGCAGGGVRVAVRSRKAGEVLSRGKAAPVGVARATPGFERLAALEGAGLSWSHGGLAEATGPGGIGRGMNMRV